MTDFTQFGLPTALLDALGRMKITTPKPIQKAALPIALNGSDILASAQTGSGKTIAYLLPLIMKLSNQQDSALILVPTRELAAQVHQALNQLMGVAPTFKTVLIIGGASMSKQLAQLKRRPQLIVGTPGRITDHLMRGSLSLKSTRFLVIDEADRMLDMGFGVQLDKIAEFLPASRQTLMFSATLPPNIEKLSKKYLQNPERITIDSTHQTAPKIEQEIIYTSHSEKRALLLKQLDARQGSIIIFVKTRHRAESLSEELNDLGHNTDAMHGDLRQRQRENVIHDFRTSKSRIMVATDIATRGLDIPHVKHVINYDLPQCPEDYVHRIGRTGRADAEGFALSFISPEDGAKWKAIVKLLNPQQVIQQSGTPKFGKEPSRHHKPYSRPSRPNSMAPRSNSSAPRSRNMNERSKKPGAGQPPSWFGRKKGPSQKFKPKNQRRPAFD